MGHPRPITIAWRKTTKVNLYATWLEEGPLAPVALLDGHRGNLLTVQQCREYLPYVDETLGMWLAQWANRFARDYAGEVRIDYWLPEQPPWLE